MQYLVAVKMVKQHYRERNLLTQNYFKNRLTLTIVRAKFLGRTHVADNVADKNISNIPVNVADMLEMLLISLECC